MKLAIKIKGAKELQRALHQLPLQIARRTLRGAVMAGAEVIRKEAQRNAPVATGELRKSIVKASAAQRTGALTVQIGTTKSAPQGMWAEFGTSRQAPRPWLRPALDSKGEAAIVAMARKLDDGIQRAAARLRGGR